MDALGTAYTTAQTNADTVGQKAVVARQKLKDDTDKAVANAKVDCDRTDAAITVSEAAIRRLKRNWDVAKHLHELATDKFSAITSGKDLAKRAMETAKLQQTLAQTSYDRTVKHMKVYLDAYNGAKDLYADA